MKKNLLLFGSSLVTAVGMTLLALALIISLSNTAYADVETKLGCNGYCVKTLDNPAKCTGSAPKATCEAETGCSCGSVFNNCPC